MYNVFRRTPDFSITHILQVQNMNAIFSITRHQPGGICTKICERRPLLKQIKLGRISEKCNMEWACWTVGGQLALPPLHRSLDTQTGRHFCFSTINIQFLTSSRRVLPHFFQIIFTTCHLKDPSTIRFDCLNQDLTLNW